ncbi:hypothetical protein [Bradyrhizobium genosp. P]|uniref:hypothetical protein n=1 Tax=Bradyrhizobium genosp. P TaxID=83641 RepID=UPI003CEB9AA0
MNLQQQTVSSGFKIVCTDCGSLSIKVADPAHASDDTVIECRRCSAARGTVADLHVLARRGHDLYEF